MPRSLAGRTRKGGEESASSPLAGATEEISSLRSQMTRALTFKISRALILSQKFKAAFTFCYTWITACRVAPYSSLFAGADGAEFYAVMRTGQ
jgi:hypothetical protein